ncbi:hypothetical protein ADICYQ_4701 [Cyclobacterium qasimii M12-11B]|uniref:Uncharacterized protein n=1 Tax=Cyclobacterium qasimii M12-11B TaxID=641524 RepID=S7WQB2_9BACT|nr:hypothetical protein ADICYQ_4701 [Cyclobacterium qasimii M12-11B]
MSRNGGLIGLSFGESPFFSCQKITGVFAVNVNNGLLFANHP